MPFEPIAWTNEGRLRLLDQTRLPGEEVYLALDDHRQVAEAIRAMRVRGAPAIGVAAAYGLALAGRASPAGDLDALMADLQEAARELGEARPTAVNLPWALERATAAAGRAADAEGARRALLKEACRIHQEATKADRRIGHLGAELIPDGATIVTHCNAGGLATAGYGTALGVVRAAVEAGKRVHLLAGETRPLLQGSRLTAWELVRDGVPVTLMVDAAAGHIFRRCRVTCVLVGADRIAANGDVANKIGTYTLALLAQEHEVPFYVAAPTSSIDLSLADGEGIPIEERPPEEVTFIAGVRIAPEGVAVINPAFDVTPHGLISAIITERGIARAPYAEALRALMEG
ncbi:MAG: S-methyl-5-thioribose-1-phosphate isomerase [Dehalococcoidia bacterium]